VTATTAWLIIISIAMGTYLLRLSFLELWRRLRVPPLVRQGLDYVPAAVLAALVLPALMRSGGTVDVSFDNLRLYAGLAALAVAWYSRSILLTLGTGMAALWLLRTLA
jgi:branched-subunit amino acid transport protein